MRDVLWRTLTSTLAVDSDLGDGERDKPSEGGDEGEGGLHFLEDESSSRIFNGREIYAPIPVGGATVRP